MPSPKGTRYDLAIIAGHYIAGGELKKRWLTVGTAFVNEDGTLGTILIDRAINFAAVPIDEAHYESGQIFLSAFPKEI